MPRTEIPVATQAWLACALLARENPDRESFSLEEIKRRARQACLSEPLQEGTKQHIGQHAVANMRLNTSTPFRYLYAPRRAKRRLYRPGDDYDPSREGGPTRPLKEDVPLEYRPLLDWYESWSKGFTPPGDEAKPQIALKPLVLKFNDEELLAIQKAAAHRGLTLEQAARQATLAWSRSAKGKPQDPLFGLVGIVEGTADASDRHDDIYGAL